MNGVSRSHVSVSTSVYEMAHGHRPSGRGSWAFQIGANDRIEDLFWTPGSLLYSEAKKLAIDEAVRRGSYDVKVCS